MTSLMECITLKTRLGSLNLAKISKNVVPKFNFLTSVCKIIVCEKMDLFKLHTRFSFKSFFLK